MKGLIKFVLIGTLLLLIQIGVSLMYQRRYIPPESSNDVPSLIEWMGKPQWVNQYSDGSVYYYELGRQESAWILGLMLSSGGPSYTVDGEGKLIGWSSDSGDCKSPEQIARLASSREGIPVDDFLTLFE
jgi:hypothetical protein